MTSQIILFKNIIAATIKSDNFFNYTSCENQNWNYQSANTNITHQLRIGIIIKLNTFFLSSKHFSYLKRINNTDKWWFRFGLHSRDKTVESLWYVNANSLETTIRFDQIVIPITKKQGFAGDPCQIIFGRPACDVPLWCCICVKYLYGPPGTNFWVLIQ